MALFAFVSLYGCDGLVESVARDHADRGTVTFTIDGVRHTDDVAFANVQTNTVTIYAAKLSGTNRVDVLEIVLRPGDIPGTVQLSNAGNRATWRPRHSDAVYDTFEGSGQVTVTSYDGNRVIGSFSFTVRHSPDGVNYDEITIAAGTFNVGRI